MARQVAEDDQRQNRKPGGSGRHQDRRNRSFAPRNTQPHAERRSLVAFQMLEVVDHDDPVARGDAEHGQEADSASPGKSCRLRATPPAMPPTRAEGRVRKLSVASRQLPNVCCRSTKIDGERQRRYSTSSSCAGGSQLLILALQHRVVAERKRTACPDAPARPGDGGEIAALHIRLRRQSGGNLPRA